MFLARRLAPEPMRGPSVKDEKEQIGGNRLRRSEAMTTENLGRPVSRFIPIIEVSSNLGLTPPPWGGERARRRPSCANLLAEIREASCKPAFPTPLAAAPRSQASDYAQTRGAVLNLRKRDAR